MTSSPPQTDERVARERVPRDPPKARATSATNTGRELASPKSRQRGQAPRLTTRRLLSAESSSRPSSGPPAGGTPRVPDPQPPPTPKPEQTTTPETWWESLQRAERARAGRLRSLWQMTAAQRVAAMRRGDLTYEQLAAWSARPDEVPTIHGEFEWIVARLAEACE